MHVCVYMFAAQFKLHARIKITQPLNCQSNVNAEVCPQSATHARQ